MSCGHHNWFEKLKSHWRHAFAVTDPSLTDQERAALEMAAKIIVRKRLETPAMVFLESSKPLNFVAGQTMAFFTPFVEPFLKTDQYQQFSSALEKRDSIDYLLAAIERMIGPQGRRDQQQGDRAAVDECRNDLCRES